MYFNQGIELPCFSIQVPPSFQQIPSDVTVNVGSTAVLTCRVIGHPRPSVNWTGPESSPLGKNDDVSCETDEDGTVRLKVILIFITSYSSNIEQFIVGTSSSSSSVPYTDFKEKR